MCLNEILQASGGPDVVNMQKAIALAGNRAESRCKLLSKGGCTPLQQTPLVCNQSLTAGYCTFTFITIFLM